jgi:hypothetical protein
MSVVILHAQSIQICLFVFFSFTVSHPEGVCRQRTDKGNRLPPLRASPNIRNPPPPACKSRGMGPPYMILLESCGENEERKNEGRAPVIRHSSPLPLLSPKLSIGPIYSRGPPPRRGRLLSFPSRRSLRTARTVLPIVGSIAGLVRSQGPYRPMLLQSIQIRVMNKQLFQLRLKSTKLAETRR